MSHHKRKGGWRGRGEHRKGHFDNQLAKRPNQSEGEVDENCPVMKAFLGYQVEMDAKNDRFERIMKINRDITIESKRLIFLLQRVNGSDDAAALLLETEEKMKELHRTKFLPLAKELEGQDIYQFLKAFTSGLQEYIEAVTFYHYLANKKLVGVNMIQSQLLFSPEDEKEKTDNPPSQPSQTTIVERMTDLATSDTESAQNTTQGQSDNDITPTDTGTTKSGTETSVTRDCAQPQPVADASQNVFSHSSDQGDPKSSRRKDPCKLRVPVPQSEYMLGVADFTGELMRLAINSVGSGDLETPKVIADMMRTIHNAFSTFSNTTREMRRKANVLRQSLAKVERACYTLQVRGSEIPKHMLADVFTSSAAPDSFISEEPEDLFD